MTVEIPVPSLGESVSEATLASWSKKEGDAVKADETIAELETDKVTLEVNAPSGGVLKTIKVSEGDSVSVGDILGIIDENAEAGDAANDDGGDSKEAEEKDEKSPKTESKDTKKADKKDDSATSDTSGSEEKLSPAVAKMVKENDLDPSSISGSGKDGRLTKGDVIAYMENDKETGKSVAVPPSKPTERGEERVKMSKLRQTIAKRLKEAQNTAALLTTFNDVDMSAVMDLRKEYKEAFEKKYGVKLGFMSFFVKAAVQALKEFPAVNGMIDGDHVVYKNYYDIGMAVGTDQGLVVPVVRDCDHKSFADIEQEIGALAKQARSGQLSMEQLTGGTFTITNGGVYGSMLSTPIINPPQSAILGLHRIEKRAVVETDAKGNDTIAIKPMMYLALSYDHRIIDGSESVRFLKTIKEAIEDPQRLILEI